MDELICFEEDVLNMMKNTKFKPASNQLNEQSELVLFYLSINSLLSFTKYNLKS